MSGTELVHYDAMCVAINEAYEVDEVKHIRDKARALEVYARQARNVQAETKACEIRLRAERKVGLLLRERDMAKGAIEPGTNRGATPSHAASASKPLSELGISHTQSSRWQKLAAIPDREFEASIAGDAKPTTGGLIAAHAPKPPIEQAIPVDPLALWLWGRFLDFERMGLLEADPNVLFGTMLDHMRETVSELAPAVIQWLERLDCHAQK